METRAGDDLDVLSMERHHIRGLELLGRQVARFIEGHD
jgi:hypothetical protein